MEGKTWKAKSGTALFLRDLTALTNKTPTLPCATEFKDTGRRHAVKFYCINRGEL